MKKLIIAEKPSLAKNIASALGVKKREDGYLESDKYVVTWAFGHLYGLYDIDDYNGGTKVPWKNIKLPFIPEEFLYKVKNEKSKKTADPGIVKQIKTIKKLVNRADVTEIIHAGDADREGQLIIDLILKDIGCLKPVKRLWLPEQTEETIRKEILELKDNNKYESFSNEGYARTYMDWLLGINLTVLLTVMGKQLLRVGRVIIPVVKHIYDRDLEIKEFKEEMYFQLESKTKVFLSLKNQKFFLKEGETESFEALAKMLELNKNEGIVKKIEKTEIKKNPGKLFSLSKLQSTLSNKNKIDFKTSLEVIQSLYEKGLVTYPRTNTEYLAENEKDKVKEIIATLSSHNLVFKDTKKIFDTSKIESHSALIPTTKIPGELTEIETIIYNTILNRFISNFLNEDTITEKVTITIGVGEDEFILNGESIQKEGFYKYEPEKIENQLPQLAEGEEFQVDFEPIEKKTSPPKKITEESLANHLKNPFKKDNSNEDEEYQAILQGVEIGTEATRTGIVENAKFLQYISQKGSSFSIEEKGMLLIEILDFLNINLYKEKSVEFSKMLKKVFNGEMQIEECLKIIEEELDSIVNNPLMEQIDTHFEPVEQVKEVIGKCLLCQSDVIESAKAYNCSSEECKFTLWKESKHFSNILKITTPKAKKLLNGKSEKFKLTKKDGSKYEAEMKIKINGIYVNFEVLPLKIKK